MTLTRWQSLQPYLDDAFDAATQERAALVQRLHAQDPALAGHLQQMLHSEGLANGEGFLAAAPDTTGLSGGAPGQRLGAYTLQELIAQGGMGQVWLARRTDGQYDGQVAIKLLAAAQLDGQQTERFRREGQILARMRHPHIAHIIDAGIADATAHGAAQPYLVLEHVQGQRLDVGCDALALGVHARLRHFIALLDAVEHAHRHLVVHRDIKPGNVLLSDEGQVKLLDFGIAKLLADDHNPAGAATVTARAGTLLTPGFAAPEQWAGEPITTATDVFALGVLLYVLLAGRHPTLQEGSTMGQALHATLNTPAPRLSATPVSTALAAQRSTTPAGLRKQLRGDLDRVLAKALQINPALRYASAAHFADDIKRVLANRPVLATQPSLWQVLHKFAQRQRVPLAVAAVSSMAVVMLAGHTLQQRVQVQASASRAATVDGLLHAMFRGMSPDLAAQRRFTAPELLGRAQAYLQESSGLDAATTRQAQMRMADLYRDVGAYDDALRTLGAQLALATAAGDVATQVEARLQLADVHIKLHQVDEAGAHLDWLEGASAGLPSVSLLAAVQLLSLRGEWMWQRGLHAAAEEHLARAQRQLLGAGAPSSPTLVDLQARIAHVRGMVATDVGNAKTALQHLRKADALFAQRGEEGLTSRLNIVRDLARAEAGLGRYGQATALLRPALLQLDERLGPDHPVAQDAAAALLVALARTGQFAQAQTLVQRLEQSTGVERPRLVFYAQQIQARMLSHQGQAEAAEPILRDMLEQRLKADPQPHPATEPMRRAYGEALLRLGRNAQALGVLQETQTRQLQLVEANHNTVAVTGVLLGCALARTGDVDQARRTWQAASTALQEQLGSDHPFVLVTAAYLALAEPANTGNQAQREHLAQRLEADLGWQQGASTMAQLLRKRTGVQDWSTLPALL
jgi:eukaryotic-like serine/threonine-protein kinase